jgi:TRAP-type C4-dicarboxylate transport system permease small subunit
VEEITMAVSYYELRDLALGHIANGSDDVNRILVIFGAYLMTAYRAGAELTRFQVSIVNTGFFGLVMVFGWGAWSEVMQATNMWNRASGLPAGHINEVEVISWIYGAIGTVALAACYLFMWSVRHPKTE